MTLWQMPPKQLEINPNELHIWYINSADPSPKNQSIEILSAAEQAKAENFSFLNHKQQFIAAYVGLRSILSRYLNIPAHKIIFETTIHGKPFLSSTQNLSNIHFNLSHSGDHILIAITKNHPVGIDIETLKQNRAYLSIAKRFFSESEANFLTQQQLEKQKKIFLQMWTAKEALLKANGYGITYGLDQIIIDLSNQTNPKFHSMPNEFQQTSEWQLRYFFTADDYISAVVTDKIVTHSEFFQDL